MLRILKLKKLGKKRFSNLVKNFSLLNVCFRASNNAKRFDFELVLPSLQGAGDYNIKGKILTLSLVGNGPFTGNFSKYLKRTDHDFSVNLCS